MTIKTLRTICDGPYIIERGMPLPADVDPGYVANWRRRGWLSEPASEDSTAKTKAGK